MSKREEQTARPENRCMRGTGRTYHNRLLRLPAFLSRLSNCDRHLASLAVRQNWNPNPNPTTKPNPNPNPNPNLKPQTPNPKLQTPNSKLQTPNSKPQTPNPNLYGSYRSNASCSTPTLCGTSQLSLTGSSNRQLETTQLIRLSKKAKKVMLLMMQHTSTACNLDVKP